MLIHETSKETGLTKKAIEYYAEQGLVIPTILENGYRDFAKNEIDKLKRIAVLRKLHLSTMEIREVLEEGNNDALKRVVIQKELEAQREKRRYAILDKLSCGISYEEIKLDLESLDKNATVTEKILEAFPGYYGRFICLHFARFLNEPIETKQQEEAYETIMEFLDNVPAMEFPEDLCEYLVESTKDISTAQIMEMNEKTKQSMEEPDAFLEDNKEVLEQYLAFMQSEEYTQSPMYRIQTIMKDFNKNSGYYDIFIPAMKRLSQQYLVYTEQMKVANDKLLEKYPEVRNIDNGYMAE
ncbi:MerR family transcriptional regulator [Anaerosporobacter faecicola]|uniref:MerR family transcriptional regulator n=1 Tax=Anaerosporobacter faecicola TaxID=2718714 RepID=UPI00143BEFB8|nr:MerR family transcriptional regulator [Anaerosporobacter faecicola]